MSLIMTENQTLYRKAVVLPLISHTLNPAAHSLNIKAEAALLSLCFMDEITSVVHQHSQHQIKILYILIFDDSFHKTEKFQVMLELRLCIRKTARMSSRESEHRV